LDITLSVARKSAELRAKYHFLKNIDSLQLAVALHLSCTRFVTNDKKLKKIDELSILLLEEII
jgi:predicted nucleic acid-binding protein